MDKDMAFYSLSQFHSRIFTKLEEENFGGGKTSLRFHCLSFLWNVIDTLESNKFLELTGVQYPSEKEILDIFNAKNNLILEFDVKIIACRKMVEIVKCRPDKFVHEFVKDLMDVKDLFDDYSLLRKGFWLFIETGDSSFEDIPLDYDWT